MLHLNGFTKSNLVSLAQGEPTKDVKIQTNIVTPFLEYALLQD